MVDESYQAVKSIERKKYSPLEFIHNINRGVLVVSLAVLGYFIYATYTGIIKKETFFLVVGLVLFLLFILFKGLNADFGL